MKKRKRILLIVLGLLLLAVVIGAAVVGTKIAPTVNHALHISELLQPVIHAENQTLHICASARVNDQSLDLDSDVYMVTEGNIPYLALEQNGMVFYVSDNILILENGKAFKLGEKMQEQTVSYKDLLPQICALYDVLKITAEETETETVYSVTVTEERVDALLAVVSLGEILPVDGISKLDLSLTERNGKLEQIRFSGSGELDATAVELDVTISGFRIFASGDYPIPDIVKETVEVTDPDTLFSLTEDLYRLVMAMAPFADMESIDGTLSLAVDCGLIQLDTEMKLSDLKASAPGQIDSEQVTALPEMIGLMCMEGEIRCTQTGNAYIYTLELDEDAIQRLSRMILPELAQYSANLTEGSVQIVLKSEAISSMEVSIEGKVHALIAQIPITVDATFSFN